MSLSTTVTVDANGEAVGVLKNDSPVKGFRIDALTIRVGDDPKPGICTVYRGNIAGTIIAQSGVGRFDQANGPYWLGPGGELTLKWTQQTPGLLAYADLTGVQVPNQDVFQQGVLRFDNPPAQEVVVVPTVQQLITEEYTMATDSGQSFTDIPKMTIVRYDVFFTNLNPTPGFGFLVYVEMPPIGSGAIARLIRMTGPIEFPMRNLSTFVPVSVPKGAHISFTWGIPPPSSDGEHYLTYELLP